MPFSSEAAGETVGRLPRLRRGTVDERTEHRRHLRDGRGDGARQAGVGRAQRRRARRGAVLVHRARRGAVNRLAHACWRRWGSASAIHVGCHLYDGNQYVETTLAAFKLRLVPVNVNFRYVDEEFDIPVRRRRPESGRHRARHRRSRCAAPRRHPRPAVPRGRCRRALRGAPHDAARHRARCRRPITRRSLRTVDRWNDGHAQGRHVASGRHLPLGHRRRRQRAARHPAREGPRRRRHPRPHGHAAPGHAHPVSTHARRRVLVGVLGDPLRFVQRADPRHRLRSRLRAACDRRRAREPPDDDRRRVRAARSSTSSSPPAPTGTTFRRCSCTDRAARSCRRR